MARSIFIFLCFLFSGTYCQGQNKDIVSVKQSHQALRSSKPDTTQVYAALKLADYHLDESNKTAKPKSVDSALFYAKKAEKISTALGYNSGLANSYLRYSKIAQRKEQSQQAKASAEKAIAAFTKSGNKNDLANAYIALLLSEANERNPAESVALADKAAKLYGEAGNLKDQAMAISKVAEFTANGGKIKQGIELFKKSISMYEKAGKQDNQFLYSWISILYDATGDYKNAMENSLKSLTLAEQFNDNSQDAVQVYYYAGGINGHISEKDKELLYLQKANNLSKQFTDYTTTIQIQASLFRYYNVTKNKNASLATLAEMEKTYSKLSPSGQIENVGALIKAYTYHKQFDKAEKYAKKSMAISDKLAPDDDRQESLYRGLVGYLYHTKQYDLARKYANGFLKYNEKFKNPLINTDMHHILFRIDSVQGNFESSLANYQKEMDLRKSLLTSDKNKQIAELQIKYDTDKKDKDLQLLKKQGELQTSKLEQSNLLRNIAFGSLAFLAVILVLLYSRYRVKQKLNRILDAQKTEINHKNNSLQKLVTEKEWLLKEIHHRVKNNLHMVISLLNTQSYYLKDQVAMDAIKESQHRINAMSLIHKKLYQSENVQSINMEVYIRELIEYFKKSYGTGKNIAFKLEIEPIELDTAQAIPLGLIINESLTNAIKHAFPNNEGSIGVSLREHQNSIQLSIRDNGVGMTGNLQNLDFESLGMKLIKGLSEDLQGTLTIKNENGLVVDLVFIYRKTMMQVANNDTQL